MGNLLDRYSGKIMRTAFSAVSVEEPDAGTPIERDENALAVFAVWGDPQISSLSPLRTARLSAACRDIGNTRGTLDSLIILGDVTEFGRECEYEMTAELLNSVSDKFSTFFAVPGNHDVRMRGYHKQLRKFNSFVRSVRNGVTGSDERYWFSRDMNGCKFIMMGTDAATFEGAYLNSRQLAWLDREISDAEKKGQPAFVFNHQTLKNTNGLPLTWLGKGNWRGTVGWQNDKLLEIFERHNNVIFITGHLHYGISRYNYEDCGCFKALSLPTVGVVNHGDFSENSQGYVIFLYEDRIELRARLHGKGIYVDESVPGAKVIIPR